MINTSESVRLEGITKRFDRVVAVDALSVAIPKGSFVCLLGPSGCGKTTTLRMIAGFIEPDEGSVIINGQDVSSRPPNKRDMGMVYQSYALFPHMTVLENVGFGLRMRGVAKSATVERASRAIALVGLAGMEGRRPKQLSGGQQQRVALARAIVIEPTVLLLDEPLSNLDAKLRKRMQLELKTLQRAIGITAIHVTHDQEEALTLADTVVIMNEGRAEQIGSPREVYANPRSSFVADFLGKVNFMKGSILGFDRSSGTVSFVSSTNEMIRIRSDQELLAGTPVEIIIRPERIRLRQLGDPPSENNLSGLVERVVFTGAIITIEVVTGTGLHVLVDRQSGGPEEDLRTGDKVEIGFSSEAVSVLSLKYAE